MVSYFDIGGTIRSRPVAQTIQFLNPLLKKFGITRVANITGLDRLNIPVALCIRPNAKHLSVSQGKGLTWELAYVSAIMEAIEVYHAENPKEPNCYGAFSELLNEYPVIAPDRFMTGFFQVPNLEKWPMGWIKGIDLITQETILLPHALVCLDSSRRHPEHSFFSVNSNGLAAGNKKEEAMCHAIYEIIERDSLYRWNLLLAQEKAKTQIILNTIDSEINRTLVNLILSNKLYLKIWDITSELNIPSFHCAIYDPNRKDGSAIARGTGTHLSKEIALSRALTEAAQSRLAIISGSRDDLFYEYYQFQNLDVNLSLLDQSGQRDYRHCSTPLFENSFLDNLNDLIDRLKISGINQIFVIDHTKECFNIPVVHIFIPGMNFNGRRI